MYQRELPTIEEDYNDLSCGKGSLNGGQYYFKSTESTRSFLNKLVTDRDHTIAMLAKGEQDFIVDTARSFGVSMCAFAANIITGHCLAMRTLNRPLSESITYHTACSGNPAQKGLFMREHLKCMAECPSSYYARSDTKICNLPTCKDRESLRPYLVPFVFIVCLVCTYLRVVRSNIQKTKSDNIPLYQ
jgi:hypothetical protein